MRAFAVHPLPPTGPASVRSLELYLESIPAADPAGPPAVLIGDFNATLDNSDFRAVLDRGYRDVANELGQGLKPTRPGDAWPPPVTIDHVLIDDRLGAVDYDVKPQQGSDHDAVLATIQLAPARRGGHGRGRGRGRDDPGCRSARGLGGHGSERRGPPPARERKSPAPRWAETGPDLGRCWLVEVAAYLEAQTVPVEPKPSLLLVAPVRSNSRLPE